MMDIPALSRMFGSRIQLGYVVYDIEAAAAGWTATFGVGPFYLFDTPFPATFQFRGQQSDVEMIVAFSYLGDVQLELIQPLNRAPSPYTEFMDAGRQGLHHLLFWVEPEDYEVAAAHLIAHGYTPSFSIAMPAQPHATVYFAAPGPMGTMIELTTRSARKDQIFSIIRNAAVQWDGGEPFRRYRDFADLLDRHPV